MKCLRCGECCKTTIYNTIVVTKEELDIFPEKISYVPTNKNNRFRLTETVCPFLKENIKINQHTCSIYNVRPCQCRLYHCGRIYPEDKKLETIIEIKELMNKNSEYKKFKIKMDEEAIFNWCNKYGWNWKKMEK